MSSRTETLTIDRTLPTGRLDTYLRAKFPAVSRGAIQRLIEEGHIRVNGRVVKPTHAPRAGEEVQVHWPEAKAAEAQPEEMPLDILFEDDALLHHCAGGLSGIGGVARPGIVHRLDKETSGCLVVAKNDDTHLALSAQFASRKVEKIYRAIVCGEIPRDQGEIRAAIARHPSHRKRMAVSDERGREARTGYRVLERLRASTFVEAALHTGRTHQIRVHFQFLGFPLAGDTTYGQRHNLRFEELVGFAAPRVMLHACRLAFIHPRTGKRVSFEAPLPEDFEGVLKALKSQ